MIRTQIQLTEQQAHTLKELSHRENASVAELTRRAIDYWLGASARIPRMAQSAMMTTWRRRTAHGHLHRHIGHLRPAGRKRQEP